MIFRYAFIGYVEIRNGNGTISFVRREFYPGCQTKTEWYWPKSLEGKQWH